MAGELGREPVGEDHAEVEAARECLLARGLGELLHDEAEVELARLAELARQSAHGRGAGTHRGHRRHGLAAQLRLDARAHGLGRLGQALQLARRAARGREGRRQHAAAELREPELEALEVLLERIDTPPGEPHRARHEQTAQERGCYPEGDAAPQRRRGGALDEHHGRHGVPRVGDRREGLHPIAQHAARALLLEQHASEQRLVVEIDVDLVLTGLQHDLERALAHAPGRGREGGLLAGLGAQGADRAVEAARLDQLRELCREVREALLGIGAERRVRIAVEPQARRERHGLGPHAGDLCAAALVELERAEHEHDGEDAAHEACPPDELEARREGIREPTEKTTDERGTLEHPPTFPVLPVGPRRRRS